MKPAISAAEGFEFGGGFALPGAADENSVGFGGYIKFSPLAFQ